MELRALGLPGLQLGCSATCVDRGQTARPRSCRHSRMAGGRLEGVRSLSPLTSATEVADSTPYRLSVDHCWITAGDLPAQEALNAPKHLVGVGADGELHGIPLRAVARTSRRRQRGGRRAIAGAGSKDPPVGALGRV